MEEIMQSKVHFGWRVPGFPVDGSRGQAFADQITGTLEAIRGRFASAWVADHFVPWARFQDPLTDTHECWTTLAYLAGRFPEFNFGTIVLSQSYRSPALLAKMSATLQTVTGGRLILGIGAGWKRDEYLAYGYDYPENATRIYQLGEAAQIIRQMWTQPRATFHGRYYHIDEAICEPKPDPLPPLMIGGGGKQLTLRVVARYADWWNFPGGTYENYTDLLDTLRGHCETVGRDYDSIVKTWGLDCVAIARTHQAALEIAQASPFYDPETSLVGTPAEVSAFLRRFVDLDVRHIILRFADFPRTEGVRLFAEEVIPGFE
jgi:alkanesulfonate monooxygenase SsuD/methylene tetrahydromethanopterin reductase-like flavin-dependent oxidoreductase (luciferase family)